MSNVSLYGIIVGGVILGSFWNAGQLEPASSAPGQGLGNDLAIEISASSLTAETGDEIDFTTRITNVGAAATPELIVNLGFVSLDRATYVDPEDWSPRRTRGVEAMPPGASVDLDWTVTPVLDGSIGVYIVVMPSSPDDLGEEPVAASPILHLTVTEKRSLNPGGVLPVVLAVPGILALFVVSQQIRRRLG